VLNIENKSAVADLSYITDFTVPATIRDFYSNNSARRQHNIAFQQVWSGAGLQKA